MILWRPVGPVELNLIAQSGYRSFPPRLPEQPIFYPVLTLEYARQIARDWNAKRDHFAGYVIQFEIDDDFVAKYEIHTVGNDSHRELWIPAEELEAFNSHIYGQLSVIEAYYGDQFVGDRAFEKKPPLSPDT